MKFSIQDILRFLQNSQIQYGTTGDDSIQLSGYSSLYNYKEGTVTWARHEENIEDRVYACIITDKSVAYRKNFTVHITVDDPRKEFFSVIEAMWGKKKTASIAKTAIIEDGAVLGADVSIGHYTCISAQAVIGDNCIIGNNVSIGNKVIVGHDSIIQNGAVIGEDGFAHVTDGDQLIDIPHYGGVKIGHHALIGSCSCICRGTIDDTLIGDYVKIDNLCHIAHNVQLGDRTQVIAGSVIMGSVKVGQDSWIATSMIRDQRTVGSHVVVGMGSVVVRDIPDAVTVAGNPAKLFERKEKI